VQSERSSFLYGAHVRANGIRQHYLRYGGRGEPLIVIPGITSPAATWGFVGERLGRTYDTYVLDVRGRGLSEGGPQLEYSADSYAKDVAEFAAALSLGPCVVLGHSMGARIAIRLGRRHARTASRLVLVDPPVSGPGRRPYVYPLSFYMETLREAKAGRVDVQALRPKYPKWSDEQLYLRAEWAPTCDETAIAESVRGFQEEDIHADLPQIRVPMLLMVAGMGGVILDEDIAEIRKLAPAVEVKKVEGAGHMIPFEDREGFFRALSGFLTAA
jgi:N-formylmaleamate deformylase